MDLSAIDARIRELILEIQTIKDQIAAHDINVQRKVWTPNIHWLNKARKAKRMREAELADMRDVRKRHTPKRKYDLRDYILDVVRPKFSDDDWKLIVAEAIDAANTRTNDKDDEVA